MSPKNNVQGLFMNILVSGFLKGLILYNDNSLSFYFKNMLSVMPSLHLTCDDLTAPVRCLNSHFCVVHTETIRYRTVSWAS